MKFIQQIVGRSALSIEIALLFTTNSLVEETQIYNAISERS